MRHLVLVVLGLAVLAACSQEPEVTEVIEVEETTVDPAAAPADEPAELTLRERANAVLGQLPVEAMSDDNPLSDDKIELGRLLYYDPRLSKNHDISCNSCHDLANFGVDGKPTSPGHKGQLGDRNSPTVYNAALHFAQFWDGRAEDVEEQAMGPMQNPVEMAMPGGDAVVTVLKSIPGYAPLFAEAFPGEADPITFENAARAIAAFERGLITSDKFDAYLAGDDDALGQRELAGLQEFLDVGCITCHMGPTLGGTMYQKLGLVQPYETGDPGRFDVTGQETDRQVFKVPSLRNVSGTAPYFHDGSVATLPEAIRLMGRHQLGRELTDTQVMRIEAFLYSLAGSVDPAYIAEPPLPESGPDTPAPDPS